MKARKRLYGFDRQEALGAISHVLLKTRPPGPWSEIFADLHRRGCWEGELRHINKAGDEVIVLSRLQLVPAESSGMLVLEVNRDKTQRRRAEEQARRYLADLSRMDRINTAGEMASGLAHELNQPLTAITIQAGLAAALSKSNDPVDRSGVDAALNEVINESKRTEASSACCAVSCKKRTCAPASADQRRRQGDRPIR